MCESSYVVIVGGGPCGLFLAVECGRRGVPFVLFEKNLKSSSHPKTLTTNARSMELIRRFGLTETIRKMGLPLGYPTDILYKTQMVNGCEIARFPLLQNCQWNTPEPQYQVTQMALEIVLLEYLKSLGVIKNVRFGIEVTSIDEQSSKVIVTLSSGLPVECQYLIGCDGSHSMVRRYIGVSFTNNLSNTKEEEGAFLQGSMLGIQFHCPGLRFECEKRQEPIGWMHWIFNENIRGVILALNASDHYMLHMKPKIDEPVTKEKCLMLVSAAIGQSMDVEIISFESWVCGYAIVAKKYNSLRCFMAGDAIHLFTPTGAYGMNTGLADVSDLGWKIAAMYHGWGGPYLLSSYEIERMPVALHNVNCAMEGSKIISKNSTLITEFLSQPSPNLKELSQLIYESNPNPYKHTPQLGYIYSNSPIIVNPHHTSRTEKPLCVAGARLPHCWLGSESLYDKLSLHHFTLLNIGNSSESIQSIVEAFAIKVVPVTIVSIETCEVFPIPTVLIIRPDQHITWVINQNSTNQCAIECVDKIRGF